MGEIILLQWFNGQEWVNAGRFFSEIAAWLSLGGDVQDYRTLDEKGNILTDKSASYGAKTHQKMQDYDSSKS